MWKQISQNRYFCNVLYSYQADIKRHLLDHININNMSAMICHHRKSCKSNNHMSLLHLHNKNDYGGDKVCLCTVVVLLQLLVPSLMHWYRYKMTHWDMYFVYYALTHWGRVTHICDSRSTIIGSDNGLSPGRRQAIIWTDAGILLIGPLETNLSEIFIGIYTFSFKKMHLEMSTWKLRSFFCFGLDVLSCHIIL